jgi:hypothetical protein
VNKPSCQSQRRLVGTSRFELPTPRTPSGSDAITKLAESPEASEQTIMSIAGHVSREMLEHYSHVRQQAKRKAVESLDNVTITAQLGKWETEANQRTDAKTPITKEMNGRP